MDPGAVLFVNENLGGHASMHLSLRDALPGGPSRARRALHRRPACRVSAPGGRRAAAGARRRSTSTCTRCASSSPRARSRADWSAGRASSPAVPTCPLYTQSIALRSVDLLRALPVGRVDRRHVPPGRLPPAAPPADPLHRVARSRWPSRFEEQVYAAATRVVAQSEWVADCLERAYGVEPGPHPRRPVRARASAPPPARRRPPGLPEVTFVGSTLERKGGLRLLRVFREHLRDRCVLNLVTREPCAPEPGVRRPRRLRAGRPAPARAARRTRRSSRSRPRWTTRPTASSRRCGPGLPVVATRVGALPEMVVDGTTGLLVTHDDADLADGHRDRCSTTRTGPRRWARRGPGPVRGRLRRPDDRAAARRPERGPGGLPGGGRGVTRGALRPANPRVAGGRFPAGRTGITLRGRTREWLRLRSTPGRDSDVANMTSSGHALSGGRAASRSEPRLTVAGRETTAPPPGPRAARSVRPDRASRCSTASSASASSWCCCRSPRWWRSRCGSRSGRPVIFRQRRVGRDDQPFDVYKFRTMAPGPPSAAGAGRPGPPPAPTRATDDPRHTARRPVPAEVEPRRAAAVLERGVRRHEPRRPPPRAGRDRRPLRAVAAPATHR